MFLPAVLVDIPHDKNDNEKKLNLHIYICSHTERTCELQANHQSSISYSHLPILRILIRASGGISSGSSSSSKLNAAATVLDCDFVAPL
jgi:hypothetical protein